MLVLGLLLRLLFINADGFKADVTTFEAWSLRLADYPPSQFYALGGLTDYPPGYLYVLWIVGHLYRALVHSDPTYSTLKILVKLPSIFMDLVDATLLFAIVRRFSTLPWAFAVGAIVAFDPAIVFTSADWGQVDSVAGGLTIMALCCIVFATASRNVEPADSSGRNFVVAAWLLLAFSVLMKPVALVLAPILVAWIFTTDLASVRKTRLAATGWGVGAALVLTFLASIPFHPTLNPVELFTWLVSRYIYAAGIYPYNSVNAFNLYVMAPNGSFWQSDANLIPNVLVGGHRLGLPQFIWGIVLFISATTLVLSRYLQRRDSVATLEAAMIVSLAYFVLTTRMHERYIFNAVLLSVPLIWYRKRYLQAAILLSITFFVNILYSLHYGYVMDAKTPDIYPFDLWPWVSHPAAFLNVATFFYLGYTYLGAGNDVVSFDLGARLRAGVRGWFSPLEGMAHMLPVDWAIAGIMTVASFVLTFVDYTWPSEKIFDEIYYARAGEEYLAHKEIFEFTHPPLTKLWITLSMILFGGMHGAGDTSTGWRFLNLVIGALMVLVIYAFAKRLTGLTLFATIAGGMLLFDGFHYVQSRIATPEITVAFFSLLTIYAFYRFWIASQVRLVAGFTLRSSPAHAVGLGLGLVLAAIFSALVAGGQNAAAHVVAFLYAFAGAYVAVRSLVPRIVKTRPVASYAEGTRVRVGELVTLDGGTIPATGAATPGDVTQAAKGELNYASDGLRIAYARGGAVRYATDDGEAAFAAEGTMAVEGAIIDGARDGTRWLWILAACAGGLAACKWNGLFDFFVIWGLALAIVLQRFVAPIARAVGRAGVLAGPAIWGNPFGFSYDLVIATMLFVAATIYTLAYIPYFGLGHNLADLIGLQQQMFGYHYDLRATHPYGSQWWQWPLLLRPISYYYHDWRVGAAHDNPLACCVAEIIAIPNPAVWWFGLLSIPIIAWLAYLERHKGYTLLVVAYLFQWLPWATSPRVAFEYHFSPNLAIICLANTIVLQRVWRRAADAVTPFAWPRLVVGGYVALVVVLFIFFFPVLAGLHVPWNVWDARMWHWIMQNRWV